MCGICGILRNGGRAVEPERLIRMRDSLSHRGPDDKGALLTRSGPDQRGENRIQFRTLDDLSRNGSLISGLNVGLGHRRLSIIDLSEAGHQPMSNENGTVWITFNGEVYNYLEIRSELVASGHRFNGNTDTEVIVHAYEEWGHECLKRFNGMFAFGLYDSIKNILFLARDRVGKKPLYYSVDENQFCFASELKGILQSRDEPYRTDLEALNFYLALGYIPADRCIVKGVCKLPPGHAAVYDVAARDIRVWQYWQCPPPDECADTYSESELLEEFEYLLTDAVKLRLISDVPLGIFLSGGLDSSLVTAIAAKVSAAPVKTFTISFPGSGHLNEEGYASQIARHFGTDHHVLDGSASVLDVIKELLPFIDEPLADSSILPTYLVSKLARQFVTVALGGDGGDELFAGYGHYGQVTRNESRLRWIPSFMFELAGGVAGRLPAGVKGRNRLASLRRGYLEQPVWGSSYFDVHLRRRLLRREVLSHLDGSLDMPERWKQTLLSKGYNTIDKLTRLDLLSYLPDDVLAKVDRASMACSLEVRAPYLDYRIVEFAFRKIPQALRAHNGETRILQRRLAQRLLPKELDLHRKQGFSIPMDDWIRSDEGSTWIQRALGSPSGMFDPVFIQSLLNGQKTRCNGSRLWQLAVLAQVGRA
jgi:asparagine synthase (glutamine-hydrolysing)